MALIQKVHLLLAMYNAMQPGVFALSGWDLVGALPLPAEEVAHLMLDGDTRWIHRGAYDQVDWDLLRVTVGQGFTGWVAEHHEPLLVGDANRDPRGMTVIGALVATHYRAHISNLPVDFTAGRQPCCGMRTILLCCV